MSLELRNLEPGDLWLYEAQNQPEMMERLGGPSPLNFVADKFRRDVANVAAAASGSS